MELLHNTNIDFMKYRKFWIWVSLLFVGFGVVAMFLADRLNLGIDFAGGTQMTLRFREQPDVDVLRDQLEKIGLGESPIQRFGQAADNEVILKVRAVEGQEEGSRDRIVAAFDSALNADRGNKQDLNRIGEAGIAGLLAAADPDRVAGTGDPAAHYAGVARSVLQERQKDGLFTTWEQVAKSPGLSPAAANVLRTSGHLGAYAILSTENVGPQIGKELRMQGFWAVIASLIGMLIYIGFRFELRFGIGAVMAGLHDVLVTFGIYWASGYEFNLITVAAFLTLIGYSMNDTVVIFDRIRENMKKNRRQPLIEVMNDSLNQTLKRTLMTSGVTLLSVLALLFLGGDVLRGFSLVMTIGIIVGVYSSIYIASPFALLWDQYFGSGRKKEGAAVPAVADRERPAPRPAATSARPAGPAKTSAGRPRR